MKRAEEDRAESIRRVSRRGLLLGGGMAAVIATLALRMRFMQVNEADQYRMLAEENRVNIRLLAPPRGIIYDRNGVKLAENQQNYRIVLIREDAGDLDAIVARLSKLIDLEPDALEKALREVARRKPFVPVTLADRLSWEEISRVAVNAPALPGITPEVGLSRGYPLKGDLAHVLGYVGPVSESDLDRVEDPDPLLQIPEFQIGKIGVEAKLEILLRGKAGAKRIEVNAAGRIMREIDRDEGTPGADVTLTLDHRLQNFAQARLAGESASAVVMDTRNGDILAIASAPAFDPNLFVRGISVADYRRLTDDEFVPLANKSVQGTYPPGSVFKLVTAMAALAGGHIDFNETVWCPGYTQLGRRRFHCWKRGGHGHMDLHNSLKQSCDVFYYEMAQRVGIDAITAMARKFGLGTKFELPMSAVAEGLTPTRAWKQRRYDEVWVTGDTLNAAIGQGFVLTSPLQLAVMTARIASGRDLTPRLVRSIGGQPSGEPETSPIDVAPEHLNAVREAMYAVSNKQGGTARGSQIVEEGARLAGKTGTSQVRSMTVAERAAGVTSNADLPWDRRDHALFVAFAPHDDPKVAVSVVVEQGGSGSRAAAPIARDIILQALHGRLPPLTSYPSYQRETIREMQEGLDLLPPAPAASTPAKSRA